MKYRCEYRYHVFAGHPKHLWTCMGRWGAMHFHVTDLGEKYGRDYGQRYSAGLEIHYRQPPDYMADLPPSQDKCWLLNQPCWHDGTSLYAEERLLPMWLAHPNDHDGMFRVLQREYEDRFNCRSDEETEA